MLFAKIAWCPNGFFKKMPPEQEKRTVFDFSVGCRLFQVVAERVD